MDLYNIPGDDGNSYRKKQFLSLLRNPELGYIDGATDYCLLPVFADIHGLSLEQRLWLAYLYGLSYSQTTAIRVFLEFPNLHRIRESRLEKFWQSNKSSLYFNPDRKYVKNNDKLVHAVISLASLTEGSFLDYWKDLTKHGFQPMYKAAKRTWFYFGPMGLYLFFDALWGLTPELYKNPDALDWASCGKTVPEGMAHLLYLDEAVEAKSYPLERFNRSIARIEEITSQPAVVIESTLCAFRKLFKGTRYVGYYADRMMLECEQAADALQDWGIDIWDYRAQAIPRKFLGEFGCWHGIRKDRMSLWLNEGVFY